MRRTAAIPPLRELEERRGQVTHLLRQVRPGQLVESIGDGKAHYHRPDMRFRRGGHKALEQLRAVRSAYTELHVPRSFRDELAMVATRCSGCHSAEGFAACKRGS